MRPVDDHAGDFDAATALCNLASAASLEATPTRVRRGGSLAELLPTGARVFVPFLPRAEFRETIAAARRLYADGLRPVPHVPARALRTRAELDAWLGELRDAGADSLLLIAGDRARAAGPYASTLDVLDTGLLATHGFRRLAIAGHPGGHPTVGRNTLDAALAAKVDYANATRTALTLVSQFVFTAGPTLDWLARVKSRYPGLPVHVGLAGPTRVSSLIAYAAHCGVGASARLVMHHPRTARLLAEWTPHNLATELADEGIARRGGSPLFDGLHVYPFGGVARAAAWLGEIAAGGSIAQRAAPAMAEE